MVATRVALTVGPAALLVVLLALVGLGLGPPAALVGLVCGALLCWAVHRGLGASGAAGLGPADVVTFTRALLTCALAALVVDPSAGGPATAWVLPLAVGSLALDAVDGPVARTTRTCSAFGSRFDGEADAFLLLVLSVHVAPSYGWWVLAIGLARYAFAAAGWPASWLRAPLPFRYWRKVVTAVQGVVLVVAVGGLLPSVVTHAALAAALVLLAESFGRDVLWLWRRRRAPATRSVRPHPPGRAAPARAGVA